MKINWTVRIKSKAFWVTIIPAVLLLVQQICAMFGVELNIAGVSNQLVSIVGTVFGVLSLIGIVNDPTTSGMSDSKQAMTYEVPKKDK